MKKNLLILITLPVFLLTSCESKEEIENSELTQTSTFSSSVDQKEKAAFDVFMTAFNKTFSESGSSTTKTSFRRYDQSGDEVTARRSDSSFRSAFNSSENEFVKYTASDISTAIVVKKTNNGKYASYTLLNGMVISSEYTSQFRAAYEFKESVGNNPLANGYQNYLKNPITRYQDFLDYELIHSTFVEDLTQEQLGFTEKNGEFHYLAHRRNENTALNISYSVTDLDITFGEEGISKYKSVTVSYEKDGSRNESTSETTFGNDLSLFDEVEVPSTSISSTESMKLNVYYKNCPVVSKNTTIGTNINKHTILSFLDFTLEDETVYLDDEMTIPFTVSFVLDYGANTSFYVGGKSTTGETKMTSCFYDALRSDDQLIQEAINRQLGPLGVLKIDNSYSPSVTDKTEHEYTKKENEILFWNGEEVADGVTTHAILENQLNTLVCYSYPN